MDIFEEMAEGIVAEQSDEGNRTTDQPEGAAESSGEQSAAPEQGAVPEQGQEQGQQKNTTTGEQSSENSNQQENGKGSESEFANEELAEANAFLKRNPDKTFDDYKALKIPTSEVSEEQLLKQYLSEKEGMTATEVALQMKKIDIMDESDPEFEDFHDKDSIEYLEAKAKRERLLQNAREWREDSVKAALSGSEEAPETSKVTVEDFAKAEIDRIKKTREEYLTSTYTALNEIQDIPLDILGDTVSFVPSENFRNEMKVTAEDVAYVTQKFFNEDGSLKDAKGFINEVAIWINEKTRTEMLNFAIDQALKKNTAESGKIRRNVSLGSTAKTTEVVTGGVPEGVTDYLDGGYDPSYR